MKKPTPKTKPANPKRLDPLALRRRLGLNQSDFWHPLGVTQSGGSCYERGRKMPKPVVMLLELVYMRKLNLERICAGDMAILHYLKGSQPDLYAKLTKAVR